MTPQSHSRSAAGGQRSNATGADTAAKRCQALRWGSHWGWAVALCLVTVWGAYVRFYMLGAQSLWMDEAFSVAHAKAILAHGYPLLPDGSVSWNYAPVHYLMALGMAMFPNLHWGARFFSALLGTLLIPVFFCLNRRMFGSNLQALASASLLALSMYEVAWCRQARMYAHLQFFLFAALLAFDDFLTSKRNGWLLIATVLAGLAILSHRAGYIVLLIGGVWSARPFMRWREWRAWFRQKSTRLALLGVLGISILVVLLASRTNVSVAATAGQFEARRTPNYLPHYGFFFLQNLGGMLAWSVIGIPVGVVTQPWATVAVILPAGAYLLTLGMKNLWFHFRYVLPVFPLFFTLAGVGLDGLARRAGRCRSAWAQVALWGLLLTLFGLAASSMPLALKPNSHYLLGFTEPQPDWARAYAWIRSQEQNGPRDPQTVSPFPVFHDLYVGDVGAKFFLPFSFDGVPGHYQEKPSYTAASTIQTLAELQVVSNGFVVCDDFGLRMLKNEEIRNWMMKTKPTFSWKEPSGVYVWRVPRQGDNI